MRKIFSKWSRKYITVIFKINFSHLLLSYYLPYQDIIHINSYQELSQRKRCWNWVYKVAFREKNEILKHSPLAHTYSYSTYLDVKVSCYLSHSSSPALKSFRTALQVLKSKRKETGEEEKVMQRCSACHRPVRWARRTDHCTLQRKKVFSHVCYLASDCHRTGSLNMSLSLISQQWHTLIHHKVNWSPIISKFTRIRVCMAEHLNFPNSFSKICSSTNLKKVSW